MINLYKRNPFASIVLQKHSIIEKQNSSKKLRRKIKKELKNYKKELEVNNLKE